MLRNRVLSWLLIVTLIVSCLPLTAMAEAATEPTTAPTVEPTPEPTAEPTPEPTAEPTPEPTAEPTPEPTAEPTPEPTAEPTPEPTAEPTAEPTTEPTAVPSEEPTVAPSEEPTVAPSEEPTVAPSEEPTATPTIEPTATPTALGPEAAPLTNATLDTVQNVIVVSLNYRSVRLNWDSVSNATYYLVQRSSDNVTFSQIANVPSTGGSTVAYTDSQGIVCGNTYYYRIQAYDDIGNFSSFSDVKSIVVTPAAPTLNPAVYDSPTSVQLSWNKVDGASGYLLYRSPYGPGNYTLIATINNGATVKYTDTGLTTGTVYYYRLQAFATNASTGVRTSSGYSNVLSYTPLPLSPTDLTATSASYNSIALTWKAVAGATSYAVERTDMENGAFTAIGTSTTNRYTDPNLQTGLTYYYRVAAVVNGTRSAYSVVKSATPLPVTPAGLAAVSETDSSIRISWTASTTSGYSGYIIEMKGPYDSTFNEIKDVPSGSIANTVIDNLEVGKLYYFRIRGYTTVAGGMQVCSNPSSQVSCRPKPNTPGAFNAKATGYNEVTVSWNAVSMAYGYEVYRSTSAAAHSFVKIATVADNGSSQYSYTHTGLTTGVLYYFRVIAYVLDGSQLVYGNYTATLTRRPIPSAPLNLNVSKVTYDGAIVRWTAVAGANGYEIMTCPTATGTFVLNQTVTGTTGTLTGQTTGRLLYIKVRAYRQVGGTRYYSALSAYVVTRPMPTAPVLTGSSVKLTQVQLSWKAIPGATGYDICTSSVSGGTFTRVKTVNNVISTTVDVRPGQPLYYKMRAYTSHNGSNYYGAYSNEIFIQAIPSAPVISSVAAVNESSLKVSWSLPDDIRGLDGGYYVRRSTTSNWSGLSTIATLTRTDLLNYVDNTLSIGNMFFYVVRAYVVTDYGIVAGRSSVMKSGFPLPTAPTNLTVQQNAYNRVTLSWVNNATLVDGFEVHYCETVNGVYQKLGNCAVSTPGTITYVTPGVLEYNKQYYVKVRAYYNNGSAVVYSPFSSVMSARTYLPAPNPVTVTPAGSGRINVTWQKVGTSYGYRVYVSENATTNFWLAATVDYTKNTVTVGGLELGKTYYVRVAGYRTIGSSVRDGYYSDVKSATSAPSAPTNLKATVNDYQTIKLQWNAVGGIDGYKVYRRLSPSGTWSIVADNVTSTSVVLTNQTTGTSYDFYVCCFIRSGANTIIRSGTSNIATARAIPVAPKNVSARFLTPNAIGVTWQRVANASGYMVLRSSTAAGPYTTIATLESIDTLWYADDVSSIAIGTKLYYRVKAYYLNPLNTSVRYSGYSSNTATCTVLPATPTGLTGDYVNSTTGRLIWKNDPKVTGYEIYRSVGDSSNFQRLKTIGSVGACRDFGLTANTKYYYRMRSYCKVGSKTIYSAFSSIVTVTPR